MSLSSPLITETTTETAPKLIFQEWLTSYFDGNSHTITAASGVNPIVFPYANIQFDQGEVQQPLSQSGIQQDPVEIRIVLDPIKSVSRVAADGNLVLDDITINFWVRAKQNPKSGKGDSNYLANRTANALRAILTNPDSKFALAQKGVNNLRCQRVKTYSDDLYAMRLLRCMAQIQYECLSSG